MKTWMIIAIALIVIGLVLFVVIMTINQWDFKKLSTHKYSNAEYILEENFSNISVDIFSADLHFVLSEDGKCRVVFYENEKNSHMAKVENETLSITLKEENYWMDRVGINFETQKITVYLPEREYQKVSVQGRTGNVVIDKDFSFESLDIDISTGDVENFASAKSLMKIKTTTGKIMVENLTAGTMEFSVTTGKVSAKGVHCQGELKIEVTTGKVSLEDINCFSLSTTGSTGNLSMRNMLAQDNCYIKRTTGDVSFEGCDGKNLQIKTTTGSVSGNFLSEKVFVTNTSTGSVSVPTTTSGGTCEIKTTTGNIKITIGK